MTSNRTLRTQHSGLSTRLASAAVGLPLLLALTWLGDWVYLVGVLAAALWAAYEFFSLARRAGYAPSWWIGLGGTGALTAGPVIAGSGPASLTALTVTLVVLASLAHLLRRAAAGQMALTDFLLTVGGTLYLGWLFSYFVWLRLLTEGRSLVVLLLLTTFASDTAAFAVGRRWGRRKLAPAVSPNKTQEGAIAGLAAGMVVAAVLIGRLGLPFALWQSLAVGALVALAGQLGDLAESALKRSFQAKDAGALIPGHGGLLDRADSLMVAGVVLYYAVRALGIDA